jgi:hypothetical protein
MITFMKDQIHIKGPKMLLVLMHEEFIQTLRCSKAYPLAGYAGGSARAGGG